jgi:hypothetical protein
MFDINSNEALLLGLLVAAPVALVVVAVKVARSSKRSLRPAWTAGPAGSRAALVSLAADRWVQRWVSVGGVVTALGLGNLIAALNWNAITQGFSSVPGSVAAASAAAAADRYALWGFALLVIGQQMVTRRSIEAHRVASSRLETAS